MRGSVAAQLGEFVADTQFGDLPSDVVQESKRILLDSLGCAIAAVEETKGKIGIEYAQVLGGSDDTATIFGAKGRSSIFGAAFANGELINSLDFDAILPPGHVSPYVLPGALAVAEVDRVAGRDLLVSIALSHELSNRFGKAMDYIRDTVDNKVSMPPILGYTSTVFGATAAITRLRAASGDVTAQALAVAASISPVNSHRSWLEHVPISTIKYTMAGPLTQTALTAAYMAFLGHRGDPAVFDDAEFGYPRFIGSNRWKPERLTASLGSDWNFQRENLFKQYPHCRSQHGLLDILTDIVTENSIEPTEITAIRSWGEGHVERASWLTKDISHPVDAQFSIAHGLAVGAQRIAPSKAWQSPAVVFDPAVLELMQKVTYAAHPDWATLISTDPSVRPSRIEVDARGRTFAGEGRYPRNTPSVAGGGGMSDEDLIAKFRLNAEGVLPAPAVDATVESVMNLDSVEDVSVFLRNLTVR